MAIAPMLAEIQKALDGHVARTRFAPSPTGYLHMGHVVHALHVWGLAHGLGGQVLLRLENHDRIRCKPEYEVALLEDLEWLGLQPDLGLPSAFRAGACDFRQSDCVAHYEAALADLRARGLVYACDCSRKRIVARTGEQQAKELRYDGFCRDRGLKDAPGMTLRVALPDEVVVFQDVALGEQTQHPVAQIGDVAIRDNHGHWTYQFAVVCDDFRHGINLIVRGVDILTSTGRQLQLAKLLGQESRPIYLHHPLLVDAEGRKLSKRDFDADIHSLMLAGMQAEEVIGRAAFLAGWVEQYRLMGLEEAFSIVQSL
jgi:glutamyl-Q tRNA(Asp) synthetase